MHEITVQTQEHTQFLNLDGRVKELIRESGIQQGMAVFFVPHTTAGITINENADPDVTADMAEALEKMVPWDAGYAHREGNSAAHVKAGLMGFSETVLIENGRLALGTWQSLYFCEFDGPRTRKLFVRLMPA
jgi:secondary thiamine-phosphate synthase enzyme